MSRSILSSMTRVALGASALAATLVLVTCGPPEEEQTDPTLTVSVSPRNITGDGMTTDVTIIATEADGTPGQGSVTVSAQHGKLDGQPLETSLPLANGRTSVKYACKISEDKDCVGTQRLSAEWKGALAGARVEVLEFDGGSLAPDAGPGVPDSGSGAPDGGAEQPDAATSTDAATGGPDAAVGSPDAGVLGRDAGGPDAATVLPTLALSAVPTGKTKLFLNVGDFIDVTATLRAGRDGGFMADEAVDFGTTIGAFGAGGPTISMTTNANGQATARLVEGSSATPGTAVVSVEHPASGARATMNVEVVSVQAVSWQTTSCGGKTGCTMMGLKGSGFNEQATVTFKVTDAFAHVVPGITVNFSLTNAPSGTTVAPTGITDAQGVVAANLNAGDVIGVFSVKAEVAGHTADSPTIGIRGAKPANGGFSLKCAPVNVGAYVSPTPPAEFTIPCDVKVVDRFNNPVGTGTAVNFKVEAGAIPSSVTTQAYVSGGANTDEGTGTVNFSTIGTWPPWDVEPLAANPNQFPYALDAEPQTMVGAYKRNPRDGLVTVLAYVRGEEYFEDNNSNGRRDADEMFIDQGEPFVDANDNGVRDPGEVYADQVPPGGVQGNGQWDPPNGVWDSDTTVWTETRILYTGRAVGSNCFALPDPFAVPHGGAVVAAAWFPDENLNRAQAAGTAFNVSHTASKGSVTWKSGGLLDGYGFGIERMTVNAATGTACTPQVPICHWKYLFYGWDTSGLGTGRSGYSGWFEIKGLASTDAVPPAPGIADTVLIDETVLQGKVTFSISGYLQ